jgi:hypothetical protein
MCRGARWRAKRANVPFNLTPADIVVPKRCPIFNTPIRIGEGRLSDNSPSLDRIIPRKGYVRGNVVVISMRANRIKSDASPKELKLLADFYNNHAKTPTHRR